MEKAAPPTAKSDTPISKTRLEELEARLAERTRALEGAQAALRAEAEARRAAEERVLESERVYQKLFDHNPLPMWIYDLETLRFLAVNRMACTLYGYTHAEFLGMTLRDIRPTADVPRLEESVRDPADGASNSGPWRHRRRDGTLIDVEIVSYKTMHDGRPARFVCPLDVTERQRALGAQRESEHRFRQITENIQEAFFLAEPDGRTLYVSPAFEEIWGRSCESVCADTRVWSYSIHPEDRDRMVQSLRAFGAGGSFDREYRIFRPDGQMRWVHSRGKLVRDEHGVPYRLAGVVADITDRKRAEEEVARLAASLERRVADRTAALEAANQELEAFDYSISHDLRAPLRHIAEYSAALMDEHAGALDACGREYLERINRAGIRLDQMVADLLALSTLTRGEPYRSRVDFTALAASVVADLRSACPERRVEVAIDAGVETDADAGLLHIALEHLIGNAWKFTSRCAVARIEIGCTQTGGKQIFHVRDNGAGFDMAYSDKLFAPFRRLHKESEFPGTGIGLATVQRIVRRHGGRIWADAAKDEGAIFRFTLAP